MPRRFAAFLQNLEKLRDVLWRSFSSEGKGDVTFASLQDPEWQQKIFSTTPTSLEYLPTNPSDTNGNIPAIPPLLAHRTETISSSSKHKAS
jgi:hypothetical protein